MKLILTSSGITNRSIAKALLELLGKPFEKSSVVFVPTAANVEKADKTWLTNDIDNIKKLRFVAVDVIDIATVPKKIWFPAFKKTDLLVFGGGNSDYLLIWMHKSGLFVLLPELLKTKIYMGISAGSMVAAKHVSLSSERILYYEKTGRLESVDGLGFVDFEIRPHLNSPDFPKVRLDYLEKLSHETPMPFYAIDDQTAIKVDDDQVSVVSEGTWKKFN